jgi:AGCS family alanine or glycine:cation symporter
MIFLYLFVALLVIIANVENLPSAISLILRDAFTLSSGLSGSVLVLIIYGVKRAAFCSEVGMGSVVIT